MVGYDSRKTESDRVHYETLGNGLTDYGSRSRNPIGYAKEGLHRIDSTFGFTDDARALKKYLGKGLRKIRYHDKIPESVLIAPVAFAGGGMIETAASEQFGRVVSSVPGGITKTEHGLPLVYKTVSTALVTDPSHTLDHIWRDVKTSPVNFALDFGASGTAALMIAEGLLLTYMAYDMWKKSK